MSKFNMSALCYFDDEEVRLPAGELPGEVDWRADFLRWHVSEISCRAMLLPPHMRERFFIDEDARLTETAEFAPIEVDILIEFARKAAGAFDGEISRTLWGDVQAELRRVKVELARRHRAIFGGAK
ncbi:hypothetical protein [Cupriavidus taiwanensis]|uniref:hypothetical protein n=1 Tax=Cupriavidus taiwanensis TaxID=164546 RepID=UPI0011AEC28C|nr:hypothetical protein [Cupriavidus taiwanensis]